jgi:quinol-cytochrome oxidoreductase complex cytochrome b subunit
MLLHMRPRYYAAASTWFTHTFRLGFITVFLFFVEVITGIVLMLYYVPTPEGAYASILRLNTEIPFGELLRDIHRLAAEGMVITTALHLLRTYLTASYKKERKFTWLTGVLLLFIVLFFAFTGYLLPWDQLSYWAVTIGTSMAAAIPWIGETVNLMLRGGPEIGADGLLRFYQMHVILLPVMTLVLLSVHYYRVARIHSISLPASVEEGNLSEEARRAATRRIDLIPDLIIHEWFLIALGTLLLLAAALSVYDAPLESPANPLRTPLETQAPWFFLWVQGLLKLGDKTIWGVLVPGALGVLLLIFPWLDRNPHRLGRKRIPEIALAMVSVAALLVLSYMGTAGYGITFQPAVQVAQAFAPDEHPGLAQQVAFADFPVGVYEVGQERSDTLPPSFAALLEQVEASLTSAYAGQAIPQTWLVVEERQADLKQVTLRLQWQAADGETKTHERVVYIHRQALEALP